MSVGEVEYKAVDNLLPLFSGRPVIFDIGSNKGEWSDVLMNGLDECDVHFFEPNEMLLTYTKVKYDYHKNITYNNFAAYSKDNVELDFFYFTNENNGLSSIYHNPNWDYLPMQKGKVKGKTITTYCKENNIKYVDIIKIDVEGAEVDVLFGILGLLKEDKVRFVQIEYSPHYKVSKRTFYEVIGMVNTFGYSVYSFDGDYFKLETQEGFVEDFRLENFIITKEQLQNSQDWNRAFKSNVQYFGRVFNFVLEVGVFEGLTSRYICDNMLKTGGRMICVDPLEDVYLTEKLDDKAKEMNESLPYFKGQYGRFLRNTKRRPVELFRMTSEKAYPLLKDFLFDFIFVDGDHRPEAVYLDGVECFKILRLQGFLLFDDYTWSEGTKSAIDKFIKEYEDKIIVVAKNEQVLIQKIKSE